MRRFRSTKESNSVFLFFFFFFKIPTTRGRKQDRLQTRKKKKILHESKHLLNTYRTEKDRCRERNIRQLHSSHTKGVFFLSVIFFRQFFNHINVCMSGTNERRNTEVDF